MKNYEIITKSAKMPASCWGRYCRIAVVELEDGVLSSQVKMISERARGIKRIIATWERLHIGKTSRCAFDRAYARAEELVKALEFRDALERRNGEIETSEW